MINAVKLFVRLFLSDRLALEWIQTGSLNEPKNIVYGCKQLIINFRYCQRLVICCDFQTYIISKRKVVVKSEVHPINSADRDDHRYIQLEASPVTKLFTFECQPCGIRYDNRRQLMRQNRDHYGPKLLCLCGIDFPCSRRYQFVEHQRVCRAVLREGQMRPSLLSLTVLPPRHQCRVFVSLIPLPLPLKRHKLSQITITLYTESISTATMPRAPQQSQMVQHQHTHQHPLKSRSSLQSLRS